MSDDDHRPRASGARRRRIAHARHDRRRAGASSRAFRRLVAAARDLGVKVIDRCNLTILSEPGQEDLGRLPRRARGRGRRLAAMLPRRQRRPAARQRRVRQSIRGAADAQRDGYGDPRHGLVLNLVFNPQGPSLPPDQKALAGRLQAGAPFESHGIVFNDLYVLANMPIQRFGSTLISKEQFDDYMALLEGAHRPDNLDGVMCRSLVSVDYRGLPARLRLQPDAEAAARRGGGGRASARPPRRRSRRPPHPRRRPLLRLHGRVRDRAAAAPSRRRPSDACRSSSRS